MEKLAEQNIRVEKITQVDEQLVPQINTLLDEGTAWESDQGEKFLHNQDNVLLLAFWDEQLAGFLTAYRLQRFDSRKAEILLYEIGVNEEFRQKGIGKALMERLKQWAQEKEAGEIWVLTNKANIPAVALYTSTGCITESTDEQMYVIKL